VIEDPDRATVRREDHLVVARMQRDFVDADHGQIRFDAHPRFRTVDRDEQSGFSADVEDVRILLILGHGLDDLALQIAGRRLPCLTEVVADVEVGFEIVLPMTIERGIDRPLVPARRHDF
jgi:hypothetical protein